MQQLRKNEFVNLLEMAQVLYEDKGNLIQCDIPTLGYITYYPKADKVQINRNNTWEEGGFEFVKNILGNSTKVILQDNASPTRNIEVKSRNELRDDFAKLAMQAVISNSGYIQTLMGNTFLPLPNYVAKFSFEIADAMLQQREL
jgi:hypothetical protein